MLAKHDAFILDIGQADIHRSLTLGIMFRTKKNSDGGGILKDLLFKAYEMGVTIRFTPISDERYSKWVKMQGKDRYIITLLGRVLTAKQIAAVSTIVADQGLNIDNIVRLTGRIPLEESEQCCRNACVELSVRGTPDNKRSMQQEFLLCS